MPVRILLDLAFLAVGASALELRSDDLSLLRLEDARRYQPRKSIQHYGPRESVQDSRSLSSLWTWKSGAKSEYGWKSVRGAINHTRVHMDGQGYRQLMQNQFEAQFVIYFSLGGQTLAGVVDTGSYELVVFSKECTTCGPVARYDPNLSELYVTDNVSSVQSYGSGRTLSKVAWDQASVGPYKNLNQSFWQVMKAQMPVLMESEFNAIFGIGPPGTPAADAWTTAGRVMANLSRELEEQGRVEKATMDKVESKMRLAQNAIERIPVLTNTKEHMFSVCMGKELKSDGIFIWNDTSAAMHPEIFHKVPVIGSSSWSIEVKNARLSNLANTSDDQHTFEEEHLAFDNSSSISLGCKDEACSFLMDTGTSLLGLPKAVTDQLVQIIQKPGLNCSNMWELPYLVFEVNGKTFSLPPDAYVVKTQAMLPQYMQSFVRLRNLGGEGTGNKRNADCELMTLESSGKGPNGGSLWIMGIPFFRKYYTSFHLGQTALDRAIYLAGTTEHCTPTHRRVEVHDGPSEMWKRTIDPAQLWVPRQLMLASGFSRA